jgi:Ulp1 family protease
LVQHRKLTRSEKSAALAVASILDNSVKANVPSMKFGAIANVPIDVSGLLPLRASAIGTGKWLGNDVMNAYINMLNDTFPHVIISTSTFFFATLNNNERSARAIWKKVEAATSQFIMVPVNERNIHWVLIVIDRVDKKLLLFDSMSTGPPSDMFTITNFLQLVDRLEDEKRTRPRRSTLASELQDYQIVDHHIRPRIAQPDAVNCGPSVLLMIELIARGINDSIQWDSAQFQEYRDYILLRLCKQVTMK